MHDPGQMSQWSCQLGFFPHIQKERPLSAVDSLFESLASDVSVFAFGEWSWSGLHFAGAEICRNRHATGVFGALDIGFEDILHPLGRTEFQFLQIAHVLVFALELKERVAC